MQRPCDVVSCSALTADKPITGRHKRDEEREMREAGLSLFQPLEKRKSRIDKRLIREVKRIAEVCN
jgi:hypothetical protein